MSGVVLAAVVANLLDTESKKVVPKEPVRLTSHTFLRWYSSSSSMTNPASHVVSEHFSPQRKSFILDRFK